jgi:hypothetical protein
MEIDSLASKEELTQGFYTANGKALVTLPFAVLRVAIFASALAREWR